MAMLLLLLLLFLSTLPIFTILAMRHKSGRRTSRRPPGPKGLPFIGNLHQIDISEPHVWFTKLSNKYGPIVFLKLCRVQALVISSADAAEKALKNNDVAFAGRPYSSGSLRLSYDQSDIITSFYSDYWRKMRKMVVHHLFSPQRVRSYRSVREDEVSCMISGISKKADTDQPIDIGEAVSSFNCNVLCRVAFGKKLDQIQGTHDYSYSRFDKIITQFMEMVLKTYITDGLVFGLINKLSGAAGKVEKIFEDMDSFYQQLIDEHLDPDRPDSMTGDILDLLIQLREDKSAAVKIDWKHIKAIVMNVFVAGTDSTSMSILWAMTALAKHPRAMKKAQEEIRGVVGVRKRSVNEDDIEKLPYLKAVVKETLRFHPAVPLIPRETIERCVIDGYEVEAKTLVMVNLWAIGRDPEYWENADEFLPERFLKARLDLGVGFIPFGSGRRTCLGASLAVANMELALANLLYMFNWEIPNGMSERDIDTHATTGLTLHKKTPLYLLAKTYT